MKQGLYQHYQGQYYHVIGVCCHSETLEAMIIYRKLYDDYSLWVRPKTMFEENIIHEGKTRPRFQFIRTMDREPPTLR
jgi:hypothetical protein